MKRLFFPALLAVAAASPAQLISSGQYKASSPNGADAIRTVAGKAVMRGIRFNGVLRSFYPNQISREFDLGPGKTVFFTDHQLDAAGNTYANGTLYTTGMPAQQFVVKCDGAMNIDWMRILPAAYPRLGAGIAVSPDGSKIVAAYVSSDRTQTGFIQLAADGTSVGYYRHTLRTARTGGRPAYIGLTNTNTIFVTNEEIGTEAYPNFTVVDSAFHSIRRGEIRPTTGRGADNRSAQWQVDQVVAPEFDSFGEIYVTLRDNQASGIESISRLVALGSDDAGSRPTFVMDWSQKDTVAFRGPRSVTRLTNVGSMDNVAWMSRYDRDAGSTPYSHPFLVNSYRKFDGYRSWYRTLMAATDDTTPNRDMAMGDIVEDSDGWLRTYAVEQPGPGIYTIRAFTLSPVNGYPKVRRLSPGFYFRPPNDVHGSIGTVGPDEVVIGLSDGWALAKLAP